MNKEEFKNSSLGDLLNDLPDAVPGINEAPELHKVRIESSSSKRISENRNKAAATIDKMLKFYLNEDIIDRNEYVKAKAEIDKMSLSLLLTQMENSEKAIMSLMDQIGEGDVAPRLYEVLSELQRTQLDIIKTQTMHLVAVEENVKKIAREIEIYEMQKELEESHEGENTEGRSLKARGARELMQAVQNSMNKYYETTDKTEEEYEHKEAPEYINYIESSDDGEDEFINE